MPGKRIVLAAAPPDAAAPAWFVPLDGQPDAGGQKSRAEGWAHVIDQQRATAIAVAEFGAETRDRIEVTADGHLLIHRDFVRGGERTLHFWMHFVGCNLAFVPIHFLGIAGMPRRIADYSPDAGWTRWNVVSTGGAFLIAASILPFLVNVVATFINGEKVGDDPWEGNTLEWATSSPPPPYNFDKLPPIRSERPVFDLRHKHDAEHSGAEAVLVEGGHS